MMAVELDGVGTVIQSIVRPLLMGPLIPQSEYHVAGRLQR